MLSRINMCMTFLGNA